MEINSFHNAEENLSYFSLLAKHAIRLELDRSSEILDFNEQLKITDYYAGIFDNISAGKSRFMIYSQSSFRIFKEHTIMSKNLPV